MTIDVTSGVTAGVDELWVVIDDTERMARCLPGAELVADFGDDKYQGRIQVALGPVKLSFLGDIHGRRPSQGRPLRGGQHHSCARRDAHDRPDRPVRQIVGW